MSKSRRRRTVNPPATPSQAPVLSDEVVDQLHLSLLAESEGDVESAIRRFQASPLAKSAPHLRYLHEVRDLGDDAPGWLWSRWILQQAFRWLFLNWDQRVHEATAVALETVHRDVDLDSSQGREFALGVMGMDWMVRQLALYEYGGLRDYVDAMASPQLLRRADRIMAWPAKPIGAFRIEAALGTMATLTDLSTGDRCDVLNLGVLGEGVGVHVIGPLVPIRCRPGWIFDSRPVNVAPETAERLASVSGRGSGEWAEVLGDAVEREGLDWPLEPISRLHPLSTDLVAYTWNAPAGELAEAAYQVCEVALEAAGAGDQSASQAAPYVSAVLFDSTVYDAARARLTSPAYASAWEALARVTHEPIASRCLALAALSRAVA